MFEKYLIILREMYVSNFNIIIFSFYYNNNYYIINKWLQIIAQYIPFILLKYIFFIQIIYKQDYIYNITNVKQTNVMPIITEFTLQKENTSFDGLSMIKYYNSNIPFNFFIQHNNLQDYTQLNIKFIRSGTIINKIININNYTELKIINDLFI